MPSKNKKRRTETPQQIIRTRRRHVWVLVALTVMVYFSALPGDFVWSDRGDLLQGQHRLTSFGDIADALTLPREQYRLRDDGYAADLGGGTWQPGVIFANTLSWTLWGKCSTCWHLESLLWHLLSVLGLYVLGRSLFSQQRSNPNGMAFWAAALFAVHPAGVASVAWIGGRPELIAAALSVAALVLFSRLQATTNVPRKHLRRWLIGSTLLAGAAMSMHEHAYLLPFAAVLLAGVNAMQRGRGFFSGIAPARRLSLQALFGMLGLVLLIRYFAVGFEFAGQYPSETFFNNFGTALRHLWSLIEQALLPTEPVVSDAWEISFGWDAGEVAALLGTVLLIGATLFGLRFGHPTAFGLAWFLLWIIPGVGLFPTDHYHSDQSLYLGVWGLLFGIVFLLSRAWRPIGRQLIKGSEAIMFSPVLLILMVMTAFSNARWWNHDRLFEGEIANDPHYIEGRLQLADSAIRQGRPVDALNHVLTAAESHDNDKFTGYWDAAKSFRLLGVAQLNMGLYNDAVNSLETAIEARPDSARSWHLLGQAQIETQAYADAAESLRKALEIKPHSATAKADLGVALIGSQKLDEGVELLLASLQDPKVGNFHRHASLGVALLDRREYESAQQHLEQALSSREDAKVRASLALACWRLNKQDEAYNHLSTAMQSDDQDSQDFVNWVDRQINNSVLLPYGR